MPIDDAKRHLANKFHINLSCSTIYRDFVKVAERNLKETDERIERVGVDEFLKRRGKKFGLVLVDLSKSCILGLIQGKNKEAITAIFSRLNTA